MRPANSDTEDLTSLEKTSLASLADLWDNQEDAIYDDWKELYGVKKR